MQDLWTEVIRQLCITRSSGSSVVPNSVLDTKLNPLWQVPLRRASYQGKLPAEDERENCGVYPLPGHPHHHPPSPGAAPPNLPPSAHQSPAECCAGLPPLEGGGEGPGALDLGGGQAKRKQHGRPALPTGKGQAPARQGAQGRT